MNDLDLLEKLSREAFDFLKSYNQFEYNDGKYDLGKGIYANIESYKTQNRQERMFEAHKKYIDVQFVISGKETIVIDDLSKLCCTEKYDEEKDIAFYKDRGLGNMLEIKSGHFIIIQAGEAHMPCVCIDKPEKVKKMVIKIPVANLGDAYE